jgi:hypothetical protein
MLYFISDFGFYNDHVCRRARMFKEHSISLQRSIEEDQDEKILLLGGDNFYPDGLYIEDERLIKFRDMFNYLKKDNICAVLGNHDYAGNIYNQFNNDYYTCNPNFYIINYKELHIYMIDTIVIDYYWYQMEDVYKNIFKKEYNDFYDIHMKSLNKEGYDRTGEWNNFNRKMKIDLFNYRRNMLRELDKSLERSVKNGKNIIIVGHYPLQSYGIYKRRNEYGAVLKHIGPLILKHKINIFIAGHDHTNQHIYYDADELEKKITEHEYIEPIFDDDIFINRIMEEYFDDKLNNNNALNNYNGIHMFICGTFVDSYENIDISLYTDDKPSGSIKNDNPNLLFFNYTTHSYLIVCVDNNLHSELQREQQSQSQDYAHTRVKFIDIVKNEEYYSANIIMPNRTL